MKNCFTDRELSWLQFNYRVLMEADDSSTPLLERLKFLNIYYSNLDEFFMVRVGSLTHRSVLMPDYKDPKTGWNTDTQLKKILKAVGVQQKQAARVYSHLLYDLKAHGIDIVDFNNISKLDESIAKKIYAEVKDFLSPRIVDAKHPMMFLGNKESYVASYLQKDEKRLIGIISLYRIPRVRVFDNDGVRKVFLMPQLVAHFAKNIFKKYVVRESSIIRVTRNADVFISEEVGAYSEDLRQQMEKFLRKRKRQQPIRLQMEGNPSDGFIQGLLKNIGCDSRRVFVGDVPLDLDFGSELGAMPQLKYVNRRCVRGTTLVRGQLMDYLKTDDLLLNFPYHSMDAFVDLLYEAADNKQVQSIKITLYRLSYSSKVAMALAYAADKGKDVLCLLELRARFDEKNNIDYSEMLMQAGCRVIHGLPNMKVHAKLCLITYKNGKNIGHITQIGTGNYNERTSTQYTDMSLMTGDETVAADAEKIFEALESGCAPQRTECLMAAPYGYKQRVIELLEGECEKGTKGYVFIKVNSMNDIDVMQELVKCSKAGVTVELCIRGICCLLPGIPGETDHISVRSIVGRYLEHSRIILVGRGSARRIFIGSGDLLNRNTNRRVEVMAEVRTEKTKRMVMHVIDALRADCENAWEMESDGRYRRVQHEDGTSSQDRLFRYFTKK